MTVLRKKGFYADQVKLKLWFLTKTKYENIKVFYFNNLYFSVKCEKKIQISC